MRLSHSPASQAVWPGLFVAELTVTVSGPTLDLALTVRNDGTEPMTFTAALHTYLAVTDVRETLVRGLTGRTYRDSAAGGALHVEQSGDVMIAGEVDRIYLMRRERSTSSSLRARRGLR